MARINVEDILWSDTRFMRLCIAMKDEARAIGYMVLAWKLAQKHWCPEKSPIPKADFVKNHLPIELIECGLAIETEQGVKMCGSEQHFAWWFQRSEAGKRSASSRKEEHGSSQPNSNGRSTAVDGTSTPLRTSISSSSSSSSSNSKTLINNRETPPEKLPEKTASPPAVKTAGQNVHFLLGVYIKAYQDRFGVRPDDSGKTRGILQRLNKDYHTDKLADMIQVFCQMNDTWFETKQFDLVTFENNLNKVLYALGKGNEYSSVDAKRKREDQEMWADIEKSKAGDHA